MGKLFELRYCGCLICTGLFYNYAYRNAIAFIDIYSLDAADFFFILIHGPRKVVTEQISTWKSFTGSEHTLPYREYEYGFMAAPIN